MKKGQKLRADKPKQYQQGWTEFYKLKFHLTEDVLIPRPETELLVDETLVIARSLAAAKQSPVTIIDIGTGSGIIAISIAKNLSNIGIVATDISKEALKVARKNAEFHNIEINQIVFIENDLYEKFTVAPDIIVTNLPYIPEARLMHIDPMVADWEPRIALDGGEDGFELYRKLFTQIEQNKLYPKYLIGEIDYTQADLVLQEIKSRFPSSEVEVKKDLTGLERYFVVKF